MEAVLPNGDGWWCMPQEILLQATETNNNDKSSIAYFSLEEPLLFTVL